MYNWHFGNGASLEFHSGSAITTFGSSMMSGAGCVSYSNDQGELMFYSNGGEDTNWDGFVWNRNHDVMPNGDIKGITRCSSSPQSALVIPKSGSEYYLFTIDCVGGDGLRYSIIDMSLDNGLGDLTAVGTLLLGGL